MSVDHLIHVRNELDNEYEKLIAKELTPEIQKNIEKIEQKIDIVELDLFKTNILFRSGIAQ